MKNNCSENALMRKITEVSFAMDELRLFLDTHPDCSAALADFSTRMEQRAELIAEYTEKYGSLDSYYPSTNDGWDWNNRPMPWKKEARA